MEAKIRSPCKNTVVRPLLVSETDSGVYSYYWNETNVHLAYTDMFASESVRQTNTPVLNKEYQVYWWDKQVMEDFYVEANGKYQNVTFWYDSDYMSDVIWKIEGKEENACGLPQYTLLLDKKPVPGSLWTTFVLNSTYVDETTGMYVDAPGRVMLSVRAFSKHVGNYTAWILIDSLI